MIINRKTYTSSNECAQISQKHVIFNITFWENLHTVICTANAIVNKQLASNVSVTLKIPGKDLNLSNEDLEKLLSHEVEYCRQRASFVFGVEYVKATENVFNFKSEEITH